MNPNSPSVIICEKDDTIYELHHAFDQIIIIIASKVLKLKCLEKAKEHFEWDFLNDIGVINLLRKDYLRHGDFLKVYKLYQSTRLDSKSYRYESLIALLIVTAIGNLVASILFENYKKNEKQILAWLKKIKDGSVIFGIKERDRNIVDEIFCGRKQIGLLDKFCTRDAIGIKNDFAKLIKCYIARQMNEENTISFSEYNSLVDFFLESKGHVCNEKLMNQFNAYARDYTKKKDAISVEKVFLVIDSYCKGILIKKLEEEDITLDLPQNTDTANLFYGMPASVGCVRGISHLLGGTYKDSGGCPRVFVVDSNQYFKDKEDFDYITSSAGVITTNTGMTGHIPVICRGLGIGCVVLKENDFRSIRNMEPVGLCGTRGIVITGVFV